MHSERILFGLVLLCVGSLLFLSCEGPEGPPGEGVGDLDLIPPSVVITIPAETDTIYTNTFTVAAEASDNDSVQYVEFYIDGSSDLGDDNIARITTAPYELEWDLEASGHGYGLHTLVARAVDMSANSTMTPATLILRQPAPIAELLLYDHFDRFPDSLFVYETPNSIDGRYFNVRFSPRLPCKVLEVRMEFFNPDSLEELNGSCRFNTLFWTSSSNLPHLLKDSIEVDGDTITNFSSLSIIDWWKLDVSDRDALSFDSEFHVGISPISDQYDQYLDDGLGMALLASEDTLAANYNPYQHHSSAFIGDNAEPWTTLMQSRIDIDGRKFDLHIRALVLYGDGEVEELAPAGGLRDVFQTTGYRDHATLVRVCKE